MIYDFICHPFSNIFSFVLSLFSLFLWCFFSLILVPLATEGHINVVCMLFFTTSLSFPSSIFISFHDRLLLFPCCFLSVSITSFSNDSLRLIRFFVSLFHLIDFATFKLAFISFSPRCSSYVDILWLRGVSFLFPPLCAQNPVLFLSLSSFILLWMASREFSPQMINGKYFTLCISDIWALLFGEYMWSSKILERVQKLEKYFLICAAGWRLCRVFCV